MSQSGGTARPTARATWNPVKGLRVKEVLVGREGQQPGKANAQMATGDSVFFCKVLPGGQEREAHPQQAPVT